MTNRPVDPIMLDLNQFASLDDALEQIRVERPFDAVSHKIMQSFIDIGGEWNEVLIFFQSASARARALHEAIVREIEATNPHATMTLLRQFAETVALTFYVADHPNYIPVLFTRPGDKNPGAPNRKTPPTLVHHMDAHHTDQFGVVYAELCEMAHFGTLALWSSHEARDNDDGTIGWSWTSVPKWRTEREALVCCAYLLELSDGMNSALIALGKTLVTTVDGRLAAD